MPSTEVGDNSREYEALAAMNIGVHWSIANMGWRFSWITRPNMHLDLANELCGYGYRLSFQQSKTEGEAAKDSPAGKAEGGSRKRDEPNAEKLDSAMEKYWTKSQEKGEEAPKNGKPKATASREDEEDGAV